MDTNDYGCARVYGLLLLGYALAGCAFPPSAPPVHVTPGAAQSQMVAPVRAIIYFQGPAADSKILIAAISAACNCHPVLFRRYLDNALIYEISLSRDETFATFSQALMLHAESLRIKAVEQDRIMQIQ